MQNEERLLQRADVLCRIVPRQILDELRAEGEWPSADVDLSILDEVLDVLRLERSTDRGDGARFRNLRRRREHRGAAEAVPDQDLRRLVLLAQKTRGLDEVADVRRELQAGEVETQHGNPACR
jgi:hypothetical protein